MAYNTGNDQLDVRLNYYSRVFGVNFSDADVQRWADELENGGGRSLTELDKDILYYRVGEERISQWLRQQGANDEQVGRITQELITRSGRTFGEIDNLLGGPGDILQGEGSSTGTGGSSSGGGTSGVPQPVRTSSSVPGVLRGGTLVKVNRKDQEPIWAMVYEYPKGSGSFITWQFEDRAAMEATLGTAWRENSNLDFTTRSESWWTNNANVVGDAAEIAGMTGTFNAYIEDVVRDAALQAGAKDPTILGKMINDPDMQRILVTGSLSGWSPEQIRAEQRKTTFWKKELYPGIEKLYGITDNPEAAWAEYQRSVESAMISLGTPRDADGSYRWATGKLLEKGVEAQTFNSMVGTFIRAKESPEYFAALQQWGQATLGKEIKFGDWFNILRGEAEADLMMMAERATLQYLANQAGTSVTADQIRRLSGGTDLSEGQAAQAFAEYDQALTALSGRAIGKYGLSRDDIFSLKTGLAPTSGRNLEEIRVKALQAATEEGLMDDEKAKFYTGFTPEGSVVRPGLAAARPEGA